MATEWKNIKKDLPEQGEYLVTDGKKMAVAYLDCYSGWLPSNVSVTYDMSTVYIEFEPTHYSELPPLPINL